jgi:hypothetical protein
MSKVRVCFIATIAGIFLLFSAGWSRSGPVPAKTTWEYRVIEFNSSSKNPAKDAETLLNVAGAEGWELTSAEPAETPKSTYLYLKRVR